ELGQLDQAALERSWSKPPSRSWRANPYPCNKGLRLGRGGRREAFASVRPGSMGWSTYPGTEPVLLCTVRCSSSTRLDQDRTFQSANECSEHRPRSTWMPAIRLA